MLGIVLCAGFTALRKKVDTESLAVRNQLFTPALLLWTGCERAEGGPLTRLGGEESVQASVIIMCPWISHIHVPFRQGSLVLNDD